MPDYHRSEESTATKQGDILIAVASHSPASSAKRKEQRYPRRFWDEDLTAWFATAAEGDQVAIIVNVTLMSEGYLALRDKPLLAPVPTADDVRDALERSGGFVNPYTFVPTPPRMDLVDGPGDLGLGDSGEPGPPSHALVSADEWTGTITVHLRTLTPLLLPDTENADSDENAPLTLSTLLDADGLPLIRGSSFKGALRSAYETITASRFGVFGPHKRRLAYRIPATKGVDLIPAVIEKDDEGKRVFRLCRGDRAWTAPGESNNSVQAAAWVPAYRRQESQLALVGGLTWPLSYLHGREVAARLRLYQYEHSNRPGRFRVWRVTHLAPDLHTLWTALGNHPADPVNPPGSLTLVRDVNPRLDTGVLSITGNSIATKHDERFFVFAGNDVKSRVETEHDEFWRSVLDAYVEAKEYNTVPEGLGRSRHVDNASSWRDLPVGTLVYVRIDGEERLSDGRTTPRVTEVHPVMIGRQPFATSPGALLDPTLRPAANLHELSPADRVFGWAPVRSDNDPPDRRDSSGYRGRLSVQNIACSDKDWRQVLPGGGVVLAPLSSPKPTQFRFYAAADPNGLPVRRRTEKQNGYTEKSGVRGRKFYRWPDVPEAYWQPPNPTQDGRTVPNPGGSPRYREYLNPDASATQTVRFRDWVRPDVIFTVELSLDGIPAAELGPLLWLLDRGTTSPLRLGSGKPHGFGVLSCTVDWTATSLRDGRATAERWRSLAQPTPAQKSTLTALAADFEQQAGRHPVLAEALESYRRATAPVSTVPVHYPRLDSRPQKESYRWFVINEKSTKNSLVHGWSLPHVRDDEQRLPYLDEDQDRRSASPDRWQQQRQNTRRSPKKGRHP
ncbi:MAG: hypothetical protein QG608_2434 [Actinomycetota bacterium]|nr:hypothetical protein [Actinomycetota bacterium]